jgi:hypothetical protein
MVSGSVIHWDGTQWTSIAPPPFVSFPPLGSRPLYGTWPGGPNSVWVVGQQSYSANYAGGGWSKHSGDTLPGPPDLLDAWGVSTSDFYAVGDVGAAFNIYHWTGGNYQYTKVSNIGDLKSVWGHAGNDIWAVGLSGTTIHFDGMNWNIIPSFVGTNLWGVGAGAGTDFWTVGDSGTILRWNGASWVRADSGTVANLHAVWGDGQGAAYVVGAGGVMLHYQP